MIDMKPAVGRYLCKDSIWITGATHRGGIITKISGKRIYFNCIRHTIDGEEYMDAEEYVMKFAAICDTKEEYDMLQKHSRDCMEEFQNMLKRHRREWNALISK